MIIISTWNLWYPYLIATSPKPPPPIAPAMAEYPIKFIIVRVIPWIRLGSASGINTLVIISNLEAPNEIEASMIPLSTSLTAPSMILATNGAAEIDRGTILAVDPIVVPMINRDMGKTRIINMIKGKDLPMLTMRSRTLFNLFIGSILPGFVTYNNIPVGIPMRREKITEKNTMYIVSLNAGKSRLIILSIV